MTGPKNPLRLWASRLDGRDPPPLPFMPAEIYENRTIDQKQNLPEHKERKGKEEKQCL